MSVGVKKKSCRKEKLFIQLENMRNDKVNFPSLVCICFNSRKFLIRFIKMQSFTKEMENSVKCAIKQIVSIFNENIDS